MASDQVQEKLTPTDQTIAEALLAKGNDVGTVASLLDVSTDILQPLVDHANAVLELKSGYEKGDPDLTFGEWCADYLAENPDNPLDLSTDKPYLSVAGVARREGWRKGQFKATTSQSQGMGRPRVDNSEIRLEETARLAKRLAETDKRKNLKLCLIEAMATVGTTDINGAVRAAQAEAPEYWKPRG